MDGEKASVSAVTVTTPASSVDFDNANGGIGSNQFNYVGSGWVHGISSSDPYLNQTVSFSNLANNFVTLTFTGSRIEFYAAKASHHGIVSVSIDNGPETNIDLYAATRQNFVMAYNSGDLPEGITR